MAEPETPTVSSGATEASAKAGFRAKLAELHPRRFFLETWERIDAEAEAEREARRALGLGYDTRALVAFVGAALLLTLMEYWGDSRALHELLDLVDDLRGNRGLDLVVRLSFSPWGELAHHAWWVLARLLGFFVVPALLVRLSGERVRDQGLTFAGFREHAWIYLVAFAFVLVCVFAVSFDPAFQSYYPFYGRSSRSWFDFLAWETMYAAQFLALEFFFRGYLLTAAKRVMGSHAIFAMVVPYVMIHFGKPMPETLAAAVAGVVLGTLAMKTRSIACGFLIHVSVALTMDVASLIQTHRLPHVFFPTLG